MGSVGLCLGSEAAEVSAVPQPETDYWLPWHVDSNFVTILHKVAGQQKGIQEIEGLQGSIRKPFRFELAAG